MPFAWAPFARPASGAVAPKSDVFRRVRPSDPAWPSEAAWDKLSKDVGGRLLKVKPLLGDCANSSATPCDDALNELRNPYVVGDNPAGTMTVGWVDAWMSAPSAYAVAAESTADVVAAVNFARDNKLRLVVKGGGHSYQGTSDSADSLLIWTRAMDAIVLHDDFVAQGCAGQQSPQPAVTIEAGAIWMHVYDAVTNKAGRYVQGGGCATVGVAGLTQSGGFGSFSKGYGTVASGLLEAEVVTADGQARIANACTNPDLFWGLKGGGGGSLGVVTKVMLRIRELPEFFGHVSMSIAAHSDAAFLRLIQQYVAFHSDSLVNPHWGETVTLGADNTLAVGMVFQGLNQEQAEAAWRPFVDWVAASSDYTVTEPFVAQSSPPQGWWSAEYLKEHRPGRGFSDTRPGAPKNNLWFAEENTELGAFISGFQSVWLPAPLLAKDQQGRLADALFSATRQWTVGLHFNKGLAGINPDDAAAVKDTVMNPAVLEAFALAIIAGAEPHSYADLLGRPRDLEAARSSAAKIAKAGGALRAVAPDAGSYLSESDYFESNWRRSFWGPNYPRLRAVKQTYDPDGLFFVHHGVGSEEWSPDGFERLG
jgi:FAD/FMN-containing dehydrogenase